MAGQFIFRRDNNIVCCWVETNLCHRVHSLSVGRWCERCLLIFAIGVSAHTNIATSQCTINHRWCTHWFTAKLPLGCLLSFSGFFAFSSDHSHFRFIPYLLHLLLFWDDRNNDNQPQNLPTFKHCIFANFYPFCEKKTSQNIEKAIFQSPPYAVCSRRN
jgi:hypothetical protein